LNAFARRMIAILRHHSRLWNLLRGMSHVLRGRRISLGAWLFVDGTLTLGRRATVSDGCRITVPAGGILEIGEGVWLNQNVQIDVLERTALGAQTTVQRNCSLIGDIEIGRGCLLAPNVFISSGRHYFDQWPELPIRVQDQRVANDATLRAQHSRPVRIGDDCWLGTNVVVQAGVTIGRGAVVGANAVVVADIAPYEIVGGVPARRLRQRLDFVPPVQVDGMNQSHVPYFYSGFAIQAILPPVAEGDFVLALALDGARSVRLWLRNLRDSGTWVECGEVRHVLHASASIEVDCPVDPARAADRLSVRMSPGSRIAVLRAVVNRAEGGGT